MVAANNNNNVQQFGGNVEEVMKFTNRAGILPRT